MPPLIVTVIRNLVEVVRRKQAVHTLSKRNRQFYWQRACGQFFFRTAVGLKRVLGHLRTGKEANKRPRIILIHCSNPSGREYWGKQEKL